MVALPAGLLLAIIVKMLPSLVYLSGVAADSSLERKVAGISLEIRGEGDTDREGIVLHLSLSM